MAEKQEMAPTHGRTVQGRQGGFTITSAAADQGGRSAHDGDIAGFLSLAQWTLFLLLS